MNTKDFLDLFTDPLFVAIPFSGGAVHHSHSLENILEKNETQKNGAYFTVNGFKNFVEGEYHGRTKVNVSSFNCNFLDIDLTPETRRTEAELIYKELCQNGLTPTAVVLTGKGLHVYWIYKKPYDYSDQKLKEYEILQAAIVAFYENRGADNQAKDAARVLRVPNAKYYNKAGEHTCDVELLYLNPETKYEAGDLAKYFKATVSAETKEGRAVMNSIDDFDFASIINVKAGTRHHDMYSASLSIIQRAKDLFSARKLYEAILKTWESPANDPLDWHDAWQQFDNAKRKIESEHPQAFIADPETPKIALSVASDIPMKKIEWLWDGFMAKGKPHMLTGEPGVGKSQITVDIASRLSTGTPFPSYVIGEKPKEPIGVIILSAEDDAADTIVPRLVAAGADLSRVAFLSSAILTVDKNKRTKMRSLALREDAEQILKSIASLPFKVGLIIIDPISAFLSGSQDSNSNSDARGTLAELQHTVMDKGIAMLIINHTNKNTSAKSAHMRSMGSVGWNAAARATFYVFKDDEEPDRRVFSIGKMNLAKESGYGFFYRVKEKAVEIEGDPVFMPYIEWDTSTFPKKDADEYVQAEKPRPKKGDECKNDLEMYMIQKGAMPAKEAVAYMKDRGYQQATIYRAARDLGLISNKTYGVWEKQ